MRCGFVVLCALQALLAGCSDRAGDEDDAGPAAGCVLANGSALVVSKSAPAGDGCNTCLCAGTNDLRCSELACTDAGPADPSDAGPAQDAGTPDAGTDEGPCQDNDDDGYYTCLDPAFPQRLSLLDCDDQRFHVQPGGIEFPDTPEDDNCNGDNTDYDTCACDGTASSARDVASAMDLCGDVVVDASKTGASAQFGIVDAYQGIVEERVRVRVDGPGASPIVVGNSCLTTLSTGTATGTASDEAFGSCNDQDPDPAAPGDVTGSICDLAQLRLTLRAPTNAHGFAFDFMFLSYEWPEFLCQIYNDTFYALVTTEAVAAGNETNAAFDTAGRPITVNVGFFENPAEWTVPLDGISHAVSTQDACAVPLEPGCSVPGYCNDDLDGRAGSGSGWLTTTVPITPGEQDIRLVLSIHDESDQAFDSIVLIDSFRWLIQPPALQTAKDEQ